MNQNVTIIERSIYSGFDFLRDIGGLTCILVVIASSINSVCNYSKLENTLVSQLYKKPDLAKGRYRKESKTLDPQGQSTSSEVLASMRIGGRQCCGRSDRIDRYF